MHSLLFSNPLLNSESYTYGKANIFENAQAYLIEIEAPGYSKDDFKITATSNSLQIQATRTLEIPEGFTLYRQESRNSSLKREFRFRSTIDADAIQATNTNGLLSVRIPKNEARLIEVQTS